MARIARYAATSGVAFGVSETTLLLLYGNAIANATVAAGHCESRCDRALVPDEPLLDLEGRQSHAASGRQVIMYWAVAFACLAMTSPATGATASLALSGHRFHLAVVAIGFPAVTIVFWLAKFAVFCSAGRSLPCCGRRPGDEAVN